MLKIIQATSRGQITLPKKWRDMFDTDHYQIEIKDDRLIISPMEMTDEFKKSLERSWKQYKEGKYVTFEEIKKKYGL